MTTEMIEQLCTCAHLKSDHEVVGEWTPEQQAQSGSPCNRCNADPDMLGRKAYDIYCTGFAEWKLDDIPWPGTVRAREVGCTCPVGVNVSRKARGWSPIYNPSCVVHVWVCQRDAKFCVHPNNERSSVDHSIPHETCEHCTTPRIECGSCGKLWTDWRVVPTRSGWTFTVTRQNPEPIWRCGTCQA